MAARDLCVLADVTKYAPGYQSDVNTETLITALITSESRKFHDDTGREFKEIQGSGMDTRRFDMHGFNVRERKVMIGDLATTTITVKIIDPDQTTEVETVASTDYVLLPRVREEWQPITGLQFPRGTTNAATMGVGYLVEVTSTVWGFPSVPEDVKEAVAAMVLWRYVTDGAASGTRFAEQIAALDIGALFANAQSVKANYALAQVG